MLSPLKFLKELLKNDTDIFKEDEEEKVKNSMAILITHIIMADGVVTKEENKKVLAFFENEFEMKEEETHLLFDSIIDNLHEFEAHLDILTTTLKNSSHAKSEILRHINNIIICDGCIDREYDVFEAIRVSLT